MTARTDEIKGQVAALGALYGRPTEGQQEAPEALRARLYEVGLGLTPATSEAATRGDPAALETLSIRLRAVADLACRLRAALREKGGTPDA